MLFGFDPFQSFFVIEYIFLKKYKRNIVFNSIKSKFSFSLIGGVLAVIVVLILVVFYNANSSMKDTSKRSLEILSEAISQSLKNGLNEKNGCQNNHFFL